MLACLDDEARIDAHPEYGRLRKLTPQTDLFFNPAEPEMTLSLLLQANPENRMAYEYLMGITLLKKDMGRFVHYYPWERNWATARYRRVIRRHCCLAGVCRSIRRERKSPGRLTGRQESGCGSMRAFTLLHGLRRRWHPGLEILTGSMYILDKRL